MTKETFLKELKRKLQALPKEELDSVMDYYYEYFEEAGIENEERVIEELKSPSHVAAKILADYATKEMHASSTAKSEHKKRGKSAIVFFILAIFAAPIALPLAIAIIAVFFALFIVVITLGVTLLVLSGAAVVAGIIGIFMFPGSAFFLIGVGLVVAGLAILVFSLAKSFMGFVLKRLSKNGGN